MTLQHEGEHWAVEPSLGDERLGVISCRLWFSRAQYACM